MRAGTILTPSFLDTPGLVIPNRSGEHLRLSGIDVSLEDFHELDVLEQFLEHHVQPNRVCDVQCMLLWSEWVRTFRRLTPGFPKLIREKEFRRVILDNFDVEIMSDAFRGPIYPGIKFVR
jgi:hypothetical protein